MSFVDGANYDQGVLDSLNSWSDDVHAELQDAGSFDYESTRVEPLDAEYRKEIGEYLSENFGMDYGAVMFLLEGIEATYCVENDVILASYDLLNSNFLEESREWIAHEQGHRLGYVLVDQMLETARGTDDESPEACSRIERYLKSENFAERVKVATGKTFDHDFGYRVELIENPKLDGMKGRKGPEEFVDPGRDEKISEMIVEIESLIEDSVNGKV